MDCLPGDIVLYAATPASNWRDRLIGAASLLFRWGVGKEQYGHAAIATGSQTIVQAVWPRVEMASIDWTDPGIEVWRVNGATPAQGQAAAVAAITHIGDRYNFGDMIFGLFPSRHAEICSVLVEVSWNGSFVLAPNPSDNIVSPDSLVAGGMITKVYG
jgi:hypothetical protein